MNIKLTDLKTSRFASHETPCFKATLTVYEFGMAYDIAIVENDGQGGCNKYTPIGSMTWELKRNIRLLRQAEDYAKSLDPNGFEQLDNLVYSMMEVQ